MPPHMSSSFRRRQQSNLPAYQGSSAGPLLSRWAFHARYPKLPSIPPACPNAAVPLSMTGLGDTPNTKARVPGRPTGSARQRIPIIYGFLSNSMGGTYRTPTLRAWNKSHPCPPAGLGLLSWYHLECPSRSICLLVGSKRCPVTARPPGYPWHGFRKLAGRCSPSYPPRGFRKAFRKMGGRSSPALFSAVRLPKDAPSIIVHPIRR